jgi:hypothetical protein
MHLVADVGYRLTPTWEAAAQLRFQMISGNEIKQFDDKTWLGTARLRRWFGTGRARLYFGMIAGAGQVSHAVDLGPEASNVRDTLKSGIVAVGGGAGVAYELAGGVAILGALDAFALFPDHAAFHADANLLLRYAF